MKTKKLYNFLLLITLSGSAAISGAQDSISYGFDLTRFFQTYHQNPQPDKISVAINNLSSSPYVSSPKTATIALISFSCLFDQYPENKKRWLDEISKLSGLSKELLMSAINQTPKQLFNQVGKTAAVNDMRLACYLVNGDKTYIDQLIQSLKHTSERTSFETYLYGVTAKWDLMNLVQQQPDIKKYLKQYQSFLNDPYLVSELSDVMEGDINEIQLQAVSVIREQQQKGLWREK